VRSKGVVRHIGGGGGSKMNCSETSQTVPVRPSGKDKSGGIEGHCGE